MKEFERNAYGISEQQIIDQYITPNEIFGRPDIVIGGILSDCQEMLAIGYDNDAIRKQLNIAKFILFRTFKEVNNA